MFIRAGMVTTVIR